MTLESKEHLGNKVHSRLVRERKSPKEIQEILDSLKARPLEYAEYKAMPQDVASWHEFANSANVDKALEAHQDEQKSSAQKADANISRMWTGQTSEEETAACKATAEEFLSKYRHFARIPENSAAMADRMRAKNLSPHDIRSFVKAFEELAVEGRLILNGKIAGICEDAMVGGHALRTHPQLHRFLKPTPTPEQLEQLAASKMSADEWKRPRPELQDQGMPALITPRYFQAARTFAMFNPDFVSTDDTQREILNWIKENKRPFDVNNLGEAFRTLYAEGKIGRNPDAIVRSGEMTMTTYSGERRGAPELPDKASLAAKIRNLSSTQLAEFFRDNPSARAAVDSL
jgi:hypothetical protein